MEKQQREHPEWLTPAEAAEHMRVSVDTLQRLRSRGLGPAFSRPVKRRVVYRRADLDEYLKSQRVPKARRRR
ncbi:MAG TPA: helix-turn-helix domain-containing protein [Planctomycetota bacterium]|nr:helix-turn-helix domain-containing protein [Planctomycetota bacterium]